MLGEPIFNRANALAVNKEIAEGMAVPSTLIIEPGKALEDFKERYRANMAGKRISGRCRATIYCV